MYKYRRRDKDAPLASPTRPAHRASVDMLARVSSLAPTSTTRLASRTVRRHRVARVTVRAAERHDAEKEDDDVDVGATPSRSMLEFAEAGFPSEEDDVVDPRARDRAMNRVVDEIHELNQAENEVLEEAFKLVEKFGLRRKKRDE